MKTPNVKFDNPETASLYKDVLKQLIYENPKIRNQAQAMEHIFESFFDINLRTKGFKNIIHRHGIEKIRALENINKNLILKHEKKLKKKNDQLLILKSQMKDIKKNNSRLVTKQNKMKIQLKDKAKDIIDYILLWG